MFSDCILFIFLVLSITFTCQIYLFKNPIYSVFSFIIVISLLMGINFLFGIEFFPLASLVIYVGAIAVLFLFIVMLLPRLNTESFTFLKNLFLLGIFVVLWYKIFEFSIFFSSNIFYNFEFLKIGSYVPSFFKYFDILFIATSLYTTYLLEFFIVMLILFIGLLAPSLLNLQYSLRTCFFIPMVIPTINI